MYRSAAVLFILLFSISAFSVDSRVERWNLRIERMNKIRNDAASGKADKAVIDKITGSEIKSSEEFLNLLDRYRDKDGSLKCETKKYAVTDIEKKVKDISLPAISLYYMSDLYKTAGDNKVKEKIALDIRQYATKTFGPSIRISPTESINMAEQYILEKGMTEFDTALKAATTELLSKTEYELSRSDYNSNETDIIRIIQKHIEDSLAVRKFSYNTAFDEKYLIPVAQWRFLSEHYSNVEARNRSIMNFASRGADPLKIQDQPKDVDSAEKEIFDKAKFRITDMLRNTTPGSGAAGTNPYYEIPDLLKLNATIDDIDRYRRKLMQNINGSENKDLIGKLKSNNAGIASRGINRIESQFRSEEDRIDRLKKIKGDVIIYNEEVFKASKSHFYNVREEIYSYANLSAEFLDALYSTGKTDPLKYLEFHQYRSDRYILYISFAEKLTSNILTLSAYGSEKFHSQYRGAIINVLACLKDFMKPETIPAEIRLSLNKEHIGTLAAVNADFRTKGSLLITGIRKNYDEGTAGFAAAAASKKESAMESEGRIGQDETDRLFSFAKKCSDTLSQLNYTETALRNYMNEYSRISGDLKKGNITAEFSDKNNPESIFKFIPDFNPDAIEKESVTREIISREGMEALSGSITLVQYYKRKGVPVKFYPTDDEISLMKASFSKTPEVTVSSWKMNAKNFRQIDLNIAAELKKLMNKNAWNSKPKNLPPEVLTIDNADIKVSFTPPAGWKKISDRNKKHNPAITYESPDLKGTIEVTSVCEEEYNLQALAGQWPERSGFSMIEKNWGKKENSDYLKCTAKNRYDGVMESYMMAKNGYIIILTGKTTGDMYRQMNRTLEEMFRNLEIKES